LYSTKEVADLFNIHTNTVRFYEKMGFLSPVQRKENGYRVFTERHINQIHIIKLIYLKEWPGKHLRNESTLIIKALPEWNIGHIKELTTQYIISIKSEITLVEQAIVTVEKKNEIPETGDEVISFQSAARKLGVTKETLRNWERNGFFSSLRNSSNRKFINNQIFEELKVIYCLRLAGLSMSFIYTYLKNTDQINTIEVYSAGDHLLDFLNRTLECAEKIPYFLKL
jgi:DNA-binding transcriptional MerR regulator